MTNTAPELGGALLAGKYRVERQLGSGGMGVVLEATHVALDQRVAIKVLNERFANSPEITARFLREARIAAKLQSDHVARVSDVGQLETGAPYIVMELLVGADLEGELRRRTRIPVAEAVDFILQAAEGVADAHAVGLVHRDLKPANLFLARRPGRPPTIKVLDFGLSKEAEGSNQKSLTATDSVFGTPQYMSPEQVYSAKNVDARSDQHALAMILYELITGQTAYTAPNVTALVVVIATNPPPSARALVSEVPRELDQAIAKALAKRPKDRFADIADFADAIAPFGGPSARELAQTIRSSLASRGSLAPDAPRSPSSPGAPSDAAVTEPLIGPAGRLTPANTHAGLTSSVDFMRRSRRSKRVAIAGFAAAVAIAVIVAVFLSMGGGAPGGVTTAASSAAELAPGAPGVPAAPSIAPSVTPSPSAAPQVDLGAASATNTVVPPAASGSALAGSSKRPTKSSGGQPPKTTPSPSVSSVIGVFGARTPKK